MEWYFSNILGYLYKIDHVFENDSLILPWRLAIISVYTSLYIEIIVVIQENYSFAFQLKKNRKLMVPKHVSFSELHCINIFTKLSAQVLRTLVQ